MCLAVFFASLAMPFMGRPASPFIVQGDEQNTEKKREIKGKIKGQKASRTVGPCFPFMRVPQALQKVIRMAPRRAPNHR